MDIGKEISAKDARNSELHKSILLKDDVNGFENAEDTFPIYYTVLEFNDRHFNFVKQRVVNKHDRRGEVVMAVENSSDEVLLHTKPHYPNGVYRLLTGGIHYGEDARSAFERELFEETGFRAKNSKILALLLYEFCNNGATLPFLSFVFHASISNGEPVIQDENENISGFKWIEKSHLPDTILELQSVPTDWQDWGWMRSIAHKIVESQLLNLK